MALILKSPRDIDRMRSAGALLWRLLDATMAELKPSQATAQVAAQFESRLIASGGEPVMKSLGFPAALSVCINEEADHGVPGPRILRQGDVVTVDAALRLQGWCADAARCAVVGEASEEGRRVIAAAQQVVQSALAAMRPGVRWSEVAWRARETAASLGATLLPQCRGHGIGADLHEQPEVGFADLSMPEGGNRTSGGQDFVLRPGLVLTVEPVVTMGRPRARALDDGWTQVLEDRSAAAFEERTVAVTRHGIMVLTGP